MAPPRTYRCEALSLKSTPCEESDLLVTLYSLEYGKLRAVAKGARKSTSRLVGHLEPLTLLKLSMARGRGLDIVTQAEVADGFPGLKADLSGVTRGVYVSELVDGFGPEDSANPSLFRLAVDVLRSLAEAPESDTALRYFELHLLRVTGLLPELYHCVECRAELTPGQHRFSPNLGGVLCMRCSPAEAHVRTLSLRALKVLRMLHRSEIGQAAALPLTGQLSIEVRSLLSNTVGYWLGKEIKSNSFLERLHITNGSGVYT